VQLSVHEVIASFKELYEVIVFIQKPFCDLFFLFLLFVCFFIFIRNGKKERTDMGGNVEGKMHGL